MPAIGGQVDRFRVQERLVQPVELLAGYAARRNRPPIRFKRAGDAKSTILTLQRGVLHRDVAISHGADRSVNR